MYLLSDFFIATFTEVVDADMTKSPVLYFPAVMSRGASLPQLMALFRLVADGWWVNGAAVVDSIDFARDYVANPRLARVPDAVVENLGRATAEDLEQWAAAWASTGNWLEAGFPPSKLPSLMTDLARLARQAMATRRRMYVWLCELPRQEA